MLHREYSKKRVEGQEDEAEYARSDEREAIDGAHLVAMAYRSACHAGRRVRGVTVSQISSTIRGMVQAYGGIDKVNTMVLPLPYEQLLKIFTLFYVFTLPFAIAPSIGSWTIPIAIIAAIGFFGLDSVGSEMEEPLEQTTMIYRSSRWRIRSTRIWTRFLQQCTSRG